MPRISAFADEIGPDLDEQLRVLRENRIGLIELRSVWGKNVLQLSAREIRDIRHAADAEGVGFSAIGSPLGKYPIGDPIEPQLEGLKLAVEYAQVLDAPYIRLFSFWIPRGESPDAHRSAVLDRLEAFVEVARGSGVRLAHENERGIYGDTSVRCRDLLDSLDPEVFVGIFDFANFPREEDRWTAWERLRDRIAYFHIKDVDFERNRVVPAGQGDGKIEPILRDAYARGFDGFLTLEPHLREEFGATGAERFRAAAVGAPGSAPADRRGRLAPRGDHPSWERTRPASGERNRGGSAATTVIPNSSYSTCSTRPCS
ncbi:MAG: hypothetical protein KatS3mg115_1508 [Candidatus Poribacteria bacterium]|nr:MAG: hypothetical protein KatS3mg115_1508 [Candidatus Poribacteria bacterium]